MPRLSFLRSLAVLYVALGAVLVGLLAFASPLVIGRGRFEAFAASVETFDFKWWFTGLALAVWLLPIVLVVLWRRGSETGLELARIRPLAEAVLKDRFIPVSVEVNARIPVVLEEPVRMPVSVQTSVDIDEMVELEADVPVKAEIPFETEIETTLLRFGHVRFPVRGVVPVDVVLPMKATVHVKARVPVKLREEAIVEVPPLEVPVRSTVETRIDLLQNLRGAKLLRKD